MAASITANPQILSIPAWGFPLKSTISWNTGSSTIKGSVYLTIIDTASKAFESDDELFDDGAGKLQPPKPVGMNPDGAVSGSLAALIRAGKTYIFSLRRVDGASVLPIVTVVGVEKLGVPVSLLNDLRHRIPFRQGIVNLKVNVGIDTVRFRFKTRQPIAPLIVIANALTDVTVGLMLPVPNLASQSHDIEFELGTGLWKVLDQETDFRFRIEAAALPGWGVGNAAEATGLFRSGFRKAEVFFDSIDMHDDGDPGPFLGAGDFYLNFGAGDVVTGKTLAEAPMYGIAEISSGESADLQSSVSIEHAPVELWVQVRAQELDHDFGFDVPIEIAPEGSDWHLEGDSEVSTVTKYFDLSGAGEPPQETAFTLKTGEKHVNFTLKGRLRTEAQNGVLLQAGIVKHFAPRKPSRLSAVLFELADRVVLGEDSQARRIQLVANGNVYVADGSRTASTNLPWKLLASDVSSPLSALIHIDMLHLLKVAADGHVDHKSFAPSDPPDFVADEPWKSLGGSVVSPILSTVSQNKIDLFALNSTGQVFHRQLDESVVGDWQVVGNGITDSLNAFTSPRNDIVLLGRGQRDEVHYQYWAAEQPIMGGQSWKLLAVAPQGELNAEFIDDNVAITVLAEDETVNLALWGNYPAAPAILEWRVIGTLTSLIESRLSLLGIFSTQHKS